MTGKFRGEMKKRLLTGGIVILLVGILLVTLAPGPLSQFEEAVGVSSTITRSSTIIEPTLVPVSVTNRSYVAHALMNGSIAVGNFTVLSGAAVSIVGLDSTGFNKWSNDQPTPLLFFTPPSRNGTFTFHVERNDTYYFVVLSTENERATVIISLDLIENVREPSFLPDITGFGIIALGVAIAGLGVRHELSVRKSHQIDRDRLLRIAKSLGLSVEGKTTDQLREEIRRSVQEHPAEKS